jgi:hypothetical protein
MAKVHKNSHPQYLAEGATQISNEWKTVARSIRLMLHRADG